MNRRVAAGVAAGAFTGYVVAVVLGEYPFTGVTPFLAGVVVALLLSEVILAVGRDRPPWLAGAGAAITAGSLLWGAWISSGSGVAPYPLRAWLGAALGAVLSAWWLRPRRRRAAPGVVVVHDWYGVGPAVVELADDLRARGFSVALPDLYGGRAASDEAEAAALLDSLDPTSARAAVAAAVDELRADGSPPVGLVGFSMGGWISLLVAAHDRHVDAVAVYYAALEPEEAAPIGVPLLAHLAEIDDWDPPDQPQRYFGDQHEAAVVVHAGTRHGFANPAAPDYDEVAAARAWDGTVRFLVDTLSR